MRDNSVVFAQMRGTECLGIPCLIKEDGYVMARTMEIEYVRIGRMKENTNEEKGEESNIQAVSEF